VGDRAAKAETRSSGPSSTRTRKPVTRWTPVMNAAALLASRTALVATTSTARRPALGERRHPLDGLIAARIARSESGRSGESCRESRRGLHLSTT
jgi:hypothetical protein